MLVFRKACLVAAAALFAATVAVYWQGHPAWRIAAIGAALALPAGLGAVPALRNYQYTAWIIGVVVAALIKPEPFLNIGPIDFAGVSIPPINLRSPLLVITIVQLVMFGMGTKMSLRDFVGVAKMPGPVLVGVALQFTVMPLVGFALAKACGFEPEIAAGVVLIGSCSSGLASNVMCYLAGANLPLSITLTAVATLLAPLATPLWMTMLVGETVDRSFLQMAADIVKMTIVPIGAAMLHDYLKTASRGARIKTIVAAILASGGIALLANARGVMLAEHGATEVGLTIAAGGAMATANVAASQAAAMMLALAGDVRATADLVRLGYDVAMYALAVPLIGVIYHALVRRIPAIDRQMHYISMFGIIYFTAVTTAAGRDNLLTAGVLLCAAAAVHNMTGYAAGYWLSRACGLDRESALTVGFEVGMQNGGMAAGLASAMGKLGTVGLAAAVFSPWMNVTGSLWANYLRWQQDEGGAGAT